MSDAMLQDSASVVHACTVDVEDYYHVSAFEDVVPRSTWSGIPERVTAATEKVLGILADAGVRGTFFVLGRVAERCPNLIRAIREAGHEVGCHSNDHRLIHRMTAGEFRFDLRTAKRRIEDLIGTSVVAYRAPSFSIMARTLWAFDILREEGFTFDSSVFPIVHDRYGMPSAPAAPYQIATRAGMLTEFPPTTVQMFGRRWPGCGGGYFRFYPYALTAWMFRRIAAEGRPAHLYIHPWELDPDQPRVEGLRWTKRFRHYVGLKKTEPRLIRLLREFRFGTVTEALKPLRSLPIYSVDGDRFEAITTAAFVDAKRRVPVATP
jgi:polysaccharide deacetylase family protein (PEP-CTERM system associated)